MKKNKKKLISIIKDKHNSILIFTQPDGQKIAFDSKFLGK
jgi:hypothetical protein